MNVSILKHGICYRNRIVIRCRNCGCIAEFKDAIKDIVRCPECICEDNIFFLDEDEIEQLKEELKTEK